MDSETTVSREFLGEERGQDQISQCGSALLSLLSAHDSSERARMASTGSFLFDLSALMALARGTCEGLRDQGSGFSRDQ